MKLLKRSVIGIVIFAFVFTLSPIGAASVESPPLTEANTITVTSNATGTGDTVVIGGLTPGDLINVYADAGLEAMLGSATAASSGTASLTVSQLIPYDAAGFIYITVTNVGDSESTALEVAVPVAGVSVTTSSAVCMTVTNNAAGTSDTVVCTGLSLGDRVMIYADALLTSLLGSASAGATGIATIKVAQLSENDGSDTVYVTIFRAGLLESEAIQVTVPTAGLSAPLSDLSLVKVYSNAVGTNDTIIVVGLAQGDRLRVYADDKLTSLLGSAMVASSGTGVISVAQLVQNDTEGTVYITVTSPGRPESVPVGVVIPAAGTSAALTSENTVTVTNNAVGLSDTVVVENLTPGVKLRVYSDDKLMNLLGTGSAAATGTAVVTIPQITAGDDAGIIFVTVTSPGARESAAVSYPVPAALTSEPILDLSGITVTNNAGNSDTVVVSGLTKNDKIRIYSDEAAMNLLGSGTAAANGTATVTVPQLIAGDASGYVYITVTSAGTQESAVTAVPVPAAKSTAPLSSANTITVINNAAGTNDTVSVTGLSKGDKIMVYADPLLTSLLGSASASVSGTAVLSIPQLTYGDEAGVIYITVTNTAATESTAVTANVPAAGTSAPLTSANTIIVKNNAAGTSDTVYITRLAQGDKISVYADSTLATLLGTATATAAGPVTVTVPQLIPNDDAGTVYITVTNKAAQESSAIPVNVDSAKTTFILSDYNEIKVTNNVVGTSDIVTVSGLSQNDKIKVFSNSALTNLLGSATAAASGTATVKIAQITPYDNAGTVYITASSPGKLESDAIPVAVPAAGKSQALTGFNTMVVTNNAGADDTIAIDRLTQGDKIRVYGDEALTVLLGFGNAAASGTVVVKASQLIADDGAGIVFVTVTNAGRLESDAVPVVVNAAPTSLPISSGNAVKVINNPNGTNDIVTVGGLSQGDKVRIYSDVRLSNLLGSASAAATGTATVKLTQLTPGDAAGSVFITLTTSNALESAGVEVSVPAASVTASLSPFSTVTVTNNALGTSDSVVITLLAQGDKVRVYADSRCTRLLGAATVGTTGTVTIIVPQLTPDDAAGSVYITVANAGALESAPAEIEVPAAKSTAPVSSFSQITVVNNVGAADQITIDMLTKGDRVRVYSDSRLTALLGSAVADARGAATLTVKQLTPGDASGIVFLTVTNAGALESTAIEVDVPAASPTLSLTLANIVSVNNNTGATDSVELEGLSQGDRIKVYSDFRLTALLGNAAATAAGTATVTMKQLTLGDEAGTVYITLTNVGALESAALSVTVPAAGDSTPPDSDAITVTNNAYGTSDTVAVSGLIQSDRVKVYSDSKLTHLLGAGIAAASGDATVKMSQIIAGDASGIVYITVTSPGKKESAFVSFPVAATEFSTALTADNIVSVTNNATGFSDVIVFTGLTQGDKIRVYSDYKRTNLLGTATALATGDATVKAAQLVQKDIAGTVYITVTAPGKRESPTYELAVPKPGVSDPIL